MPIPLRCSVQDMQTIERGKKRAACHDRRDRQLEELTHIL